MISLTTFLKACIFTKKRFQHRCFPVNISKVFGKVFALNFSITKSFKKKER